MEDNLDGLAEIPTKYFSTIFQLTFLQDCARSLH